jgi:arsenate reductase
MYKNLLSTLLKVSSIELTEDRKTKVQPLLTYIQDKVSTKQPIRLTFICTHNSRRSHLRQIWAQALAFHYGLNSIQCYSGGTEVTALFPKVVDTLLAQGFKIEQLSSSNNPVYAIKFDENALPIIGFSKTFDDFFNPASHFAALMTCSSADEGCPFIAGAEVRIPLRYEDPKLFDGTDLMEEKYSERSLEIAADMNYIFSQIKQ